jgi:hypothetical protein
MPSSPALPPRGGLAECRIVEALRPPETVGQALGGRTPALLIVFFRFAAPLKRLIALADERSEDL